VTGPPAPPPPPLRWRARAYLLVGAGTVLLLLAIAARDPIPVFVAVPLLVAPVAAGLGSPSSSRPVSLRWSDEGTGRKVELTGTLSGEASARPDDWVVEFAQPLPLPEAAPPDVARGPGGLRFRLHWTAPEPTVVRIASPSAVWRDPMGLVERPLPGERPDIVVERYPPELLRLGAIRLERTLLLPGETQSRRLGASGEFFGIRDAAPNEPPRRINWVASARAGHLVANDFQLDRSADLLILLDCRPTPLGPALDSRLLGISRAAAQGIVDSCLRAKLRVGYATFGEFAACVPLSSGRIHQARLHRAILATQRSSVEGPSERCAVSLRRFYPPSLTTLLLSPLVGESSLDLVPHLKRRGFPVVVLSPSPLPVSPQLVSIPAEDEALAARLGRLERREQLATAWLHAPVVDWDEYWSLAGLVRMLRRPAVRRGA
jgi:uncharacterized protein (DUF58 family)